MISRDHDSQRIKLEKLKYPIIAGTGFGLFMILIDQIQGTEIFWLLVSSRTAATILTFCMIFYSGQKLNFSGMKLLPLVLFAGLLDTGGNVFYVLAARTGRLDIAAILSY
ncbi:MAG: hypothetical protein R2741_02430 [Methanolobus sp.]